MKISTDDRTNLIAYTVDGLPDIDNTLKDIAEIVNSLYPCVSAYKALNVVDAPRELMLI